MNGYTAGNLDSKQLFSRVTRGGAHWNFLFEVC